ncbi:hypothetical protein H5392_14025 [Tessaracoccus sp. MC1865]|uniref:hypothetical protein n=1 Tax=Tessaracoccus sp. MC1865 TaxID=2760310 RepID=UPI001603292C|nr:hypothetical protein [Tessaracoccus sp. MC1865]MBB1484975.1 hypothetical protein [Tessaracoccus sp. MC1865]QTO38678.1 hypothetical protein J7D54_06300 [Tessaracoccus sp. MC1865]
MALDTVTVTSYTNDLGNSGVNITGPKGTILVTKDGDRFSDRYLSWWSDQITTLASSRNQQRLIDDAIRRVTA